jgi:pentatricopeptide repeat protein
MFFPSPSTKSIHSLRQRRQCTQSSSNKPITPFRSNTAKKPSLKSTKKKKKDGFPYSPVPTEYMRHIIVNIYRTLKYSSWDSAERELQNLPLKWDSYTVNQVLKSHPPMEKAWLFFNWASRIKGFKHDQFTYTTMLNIFGEAGRISSMKHIFNHMQEKGIRIDSVTYTSMMHWLSSSGNVDEAIALWDEMKSKGCHPTAVSYTAFIKILFDTHRVKEATGVYKEMIHSGSVPTCYTYTVLMDHLIASG